MAKKNASILATSRFRVLTRNIDYITYGDDGTPFGIPGPYMNVFYSGTQHPRDPMCFITLVGDEARSFSGWVQGQAGWIQFDGLSINPANISLIRLPDDPATAGRIGVQFTSGNHLEIPDNSSQIFLTVYDAALTKAQA